MACGCGRTELNIEHFIELKSFHCCKIFFLKEGLEDLSSLRYFRDLKNPGGFFNR